MTGHTGFKGSWLVQLLHRYGACVHGLALAANTQPALFALADIDSLCVSSHLCDITGCDVVSLVADIQPDIVFHLAAQPLVRMSYTAPRETFKTNIMGTVNLLEAVLNCSHTQATVVVTSDKVYRNLENGRCYVETDPLGGHDPYSASKAACELVVDSYRRSFFNDCGRALATARAGNVIGGGDWAPDRLIPDLIRSWFAHQPLTIRHPEAVRPWQHVLEPLYGYLMLAEQLYQQPQLSDAYNFGPPDNTQFSVRTMIENMQFFFPELQVQFGVSNTQPHEACLLNLDASKAADILGWKGGWDQAKTIAKTAQWYRQFYQDSDPRELCVADIADYERERGSYEI